MKNIVKNKVKSILNKYIYNIILTLVIFILFLVAGYSSRKLDYKVYINDKRVSVVNRIYSVNNEHYIHIEDLTNLFKKNIYDDKISGKIIITTFDNLIKINKNDGEYAIKEDGNIYFNLKKIMAHIGNNVAYIRDKIYILPENFVDGNIKNNRVELYDKQTGNVTLHLSKGEKVKVYIDSDLNNVNIKIVNVSVNVQGKLFYGYMLKDNVEYDYILSKESGDNNKIVLVKAEGNVASSTDKQKTDIIAMSMYRLSNVNTLTKLQDIDHSIQQDKIIATINNGQKAANYDQAIVTGMLSSEENRYEIIKQILNGTKNLAGANLDFANLRTLDKDKYTQFVKELAATMHKNNKILVVNITSTQHIDYEQIVEVVDYIVIQPYFSRTMSSKTSGPISSIKYVEQCITDLISKQIDFNKVILEIPAYTILWTERRGTVINAEQYNMKAMQTYVKQNNLEIKREDVSGQNYINYTKGITTYKMWLEDEYSVIKKVELVNKYDLAGLAIYKSGMETKEIYGSILDTLEN